MKLNTLKLPHSVISDLYSKSLVTIGSDGSEEQKPLLAPIPVVKNIFPVATAQIQFLGENKKNILILVNYENISYLPDEELPYQYAFRL